MKTIDQIKKDSHLCRRKIAIAEIKILRNLEDRNLIQEKISRELRKLHMLWFKGSTREMSNSEV